MNDKPEKAEGNGAKQIELAQVDRVQMVGMTGKDGERRTTVHWTSPNGRKDEGHTLDDVDDQPKESFRAAWAALKPLVLPLLDLEKAKGWVGNAVVTKLHITRTKSGRRGIIFTVYRELDHGGTTLNTPIRFERDDETQDGMMYASKELIAAVAAVELEALAFTRWIRTAQGELLGTGTSGD